MTTFEFDNTEFHAQMWAFYEGRKMYIIATNFSERLFALVPERQATPADEWQWARCENVKLVKGKIVNIQDSHFYKKDKS